MFNVAQFIFKTCYLNDLQNNCYTMLLMKTWSLKKVNYFTVCDKYIITKQNQKEEDKNNKKRKRRSKRRNRTLVRFVNHYNRVLLLFLVDDK